MAGVLHDFRQDAAFATRASIRSPGFALAVIGILAIGIAAVSTMFSVADAVILRPLPYPDAERIVQAGIRLDDRILVSLDDFDRLAPAFERPAASRWDSFSITGDGDAERLDGDRVQANFFPLFGARARLGRVFSNAGDGAGVVISDALWRRRYGGDPAILGRKIDLNFEPFTIIGVLAPGFRDPEGYRRHASIDIWIPLVRAKERYPSRRLYVMQGRLAEGVTGISARARLAAMNGADLQPLREWITASVRPQLLILLAAVGLVMLIACANAAALMLARMNSRRREIAIRVSLGAGRGRLMRQLLAESLTLTIPAVVAGFALARGLLAAALPFVPGELPRAGAIGLNGRAALFAMALAMITGIACGILPAFRAAARTAPRRPVAPALVIIQIATSLILVASAALLMESFYRYSQVDLGFGTKEILTMQVRLPASKYPDSGRRIQFYDAALRELKNIPGVASAAMVTALPLGGAGFEEAFSLQDRPAASDRDREIAEWNLISPEYFATMGIPLISGGLPTPMDEKGNLPVVVVNSALARKEWPGEDPVGKRIRFGSIRDTPKWLEVIGVVGGVKQLGLRVPDDPQVYELYSELPPPYATFVLRASNPLSVARAAAKAIQSVDRDLPVDRVATMAGIFSQSLSAPRFRALLMGAFALIALGLAGAGIFAALYSWVEQRRREMAIRMALGATPGRMIFSALGYAAWLASAGVVLGLLGALATARLLRDLVFGIDTGYPPAFVLAAAILLATALFAGLVPARRAAAFNPAVMLKQE